MAIKMEWSDDAGWIPVDTDTGMYSAAADQAINAERAARGIDVRDPGMTYRPDVTTTLGARPGQPATYSAGFGQIADPLITLANLARDPGALRRETGQVNSAGIQFMQDIQEAAQKMAVDPLAAALAQQNLTPYYEEEEPAPPV